MNPETYTILLASSQSADHDALQRALGGEFHLIQAPPNAEAVEVAVARQPDMILAELGKPADPLPLCERFTGDSRTSKMPIFLVVDAGHELQCEPWVGHGVLDVLSRPFVPGLTLARIRNGIALRQYRDLLGRITSIDPVTAIANRRRFEEYLELEWRRNQRNQTSMALLVMDLDHFQTFGGEYGKAAADEALRQVADAMVAVIQRAGDLIARLSGGRFAVVLPETDVVGAVSVAERMRAEVAALAITHAQSRTAETLTLSVGVTTRVPGNTGAWEDLLAEAERRLNQAKARGRNQVVFG